MTNQVSVKTFTSLRDATKGSHVKRVIKSLEDAGLASWRDFGDIQDNFGRIHMMSDPAGAIIERVTNAIDASLETRAEDHPELVATCKSPRMFAEKAFKIPNGYLKNMLPKLREKLVDELNIEIETRDGDSDETPTIDVRDRGAGIQRSEMPNTILGLNRGVKITKWYLMGMYGQGGSTTLAFSEYVVYLTRRQVHGKADAKVSFTVAKYQEPQAGEKGGRYVYLVSADDKLPFEVQANESEFGAGTLVKHVNYRLGKIPFIDFYSLLERFLFDPILPFWYRERRTTKPFAGNLDSGRRIFGSRDRLERTDLIDSKWKEELVCDLDELGKFTARYYVFRRGTPEKEKKTFINPANPIVVTYNGQSQDTLPRRIITYDCDLSYLASDIAVQIDCEQLSDKGRLRFFATTREVITKEGRDKIIEKIGPALRDELQQLNIQREQESFTEGISKGTEELRRKLAEAINRIKPGSVQIAIGKAGKGGNKSHSHGSRKSKPPLELKDFPTYIKIANVDDPIHVSQKWTRWIELDSDAPDGFLQNHSGKVILSEDSPKFIKEIIHHPDFKGGRYYISVKAFESTEPGTQFKLGVSLKVPTDKGTTGLGDVRDSIIVKPSQAGGKESDISIDAPDPIPVPPDSKYWNDNNWTPKNVAEVKEGLHTKIYISMGNEWLMGALAQSKYAQAYKDNLKERYLLSVAAFAYFQNEAYKALLKKPKAEEGSQQKEDKTDSMGDAIELVRQIDLESTARAIMTSITAEHSFKGKNSAEE